MDDFDLALVSERVVLPDGVRPAVVAIKDGVIAAIITRKRLGSAGEIIDLAGSVLLPGLVDSHVHVNEPGRADWEGFETATRAAAAGGVTTLVDMPLNSVPVTTTVAALREKAESAEGRCVVDYGFWGGVVPGNAHELEPLLDAGVLGFKCFTCPSGIDEFPQVTETDLRAAMSVMAERDAVLLVHAEDPRLIEAAGRLSELPESPRSYANYLASRPPEAEQHAIEWLIGLCKELGCRLHIVHLSSAAAIPAIRQAKCEGLRLTVETCPHYLKFAAEQIPDGATLYKCAPPIRDRRNREALWAALLDGELEMIVSDHSPCPPAMKLLGSGDFCRAWGGISSLQLGLSVIWGEAGRCEDGLQRVAEWMCAAPARLAGLGNQKGSIIVGYDADLVVFDPDRTFVVEAATLHHRHAQTPYAEMELCGTVEKTFVRGQLVYDRPDFPERCIGQRLVGHIR
ncbi:MAG: allantoinase AllB [Acidobacteriota bacterium]